MKFSVLFLCIWVALVNQLACFRDKFDGPDDHDGPDDFDSGERHDDLERSDRFGRPDRSKDKHKVEKLSPILIAARNGKQDDYFSFYC